jgi:acetylglutamate kinase
MQIWFRVCSTNMASQESQEQEAARSRVTRAANFPAARNAGESALQEFILENLELFNATGNVAGSVSAAPVGSTLLENNIITSQKRTKTQGTGIQISGALDELWLLVPGRIKLMLVQVMEH